jgi:hypothetical protein
MGGQQEATLSNYEQFKILFNLANSSYSNDLIQPDDIQSRMQNPKNELRVENLVTSYEAQKKELDLVHSPDSALINLFLMTYGKDLSDVNIHTGPYAEAMTRKAGAEALTFGKDIYFSSGSYSPNTEEGEALLLHEVEHVSQNKKGNRLTYREDVEKAEKEAYSREKLTGKRSEESDLFEIWKQDDLIFKNKELSGGLDATDKDLEDFSNSDPIVIYRYLSTSGKVIEMTKEEYSECLVEVKEKLATYFEDEMNYGTEDDKIDAAHQIVKIFGI